MDVLVLVTMNSTNNEINDKFHDNYARLGMMSIDPLKTYNVEQHQDRNPPFECEILELHLCNLAVAREKPDGELGKM